MRGCEGECPFELEGCLEEVWLELGLSSGEDLESGGMKESREERLGGKNEQRGRAGEASCSERRGGEALCWGEGGEKGGRWWNPSPPFLVALHPSGILVGQRMNLARGEQN